MERCSPCLVSTLPQQAPCWEEDGAFQKTSGWEQTGRGRDREEGTTEKLKMQTMSWAQGAKRDFCTFFFNLEEPYI